MRVHRSEDVGPRDIGELDQRSLAAPPGVLVLAYAVAMAVYRHTIS